MKFKNKIAFTKKRNKFPIFIKNNQYHLGNYNKTEIIDDYLDAIQSKNDTRGERGVLQKYMSLNIYSKDPNNSTTKERLFRHFKGLGPHKNSSDIKFFVKDIIRFGNAMVMLNNLIYYCENLGFKNIYLNSKHKWFLRDKVVTDKMNITILPSKNVNCHAKDIICFKFYSGPGCFLLYQATSKPEIRVGIIKDEKKKNLPHVITNPNDLYIHMKSGDVFRSRVAYGYAQPPLCFYKTILENFKFNNIYIISENNVNPIINKLLNFLIFKILFIFKCKSQRISEYKLS